MLRNAPVSILIMYVYKDLLQGCIAHFWSNVLHLLIYWDIWENTRLFNFWNKWVVYKSWEMAQKIKSFSAFVCVFYKLTAHLWYWKNVWKLKCAVNCIKVFSHCQQIIFFSWFWLLVYWELKSASKFVTIHSEQLI